MVVAPGSRYTGFGRAAGTSRPAPAYAWGMDPSLSTAARTLSKGLRTSNPATAALGAALIGLLLLRRRREEAAGTLVHRATLRPGESLEVVLRESAPRRPRALTPDT